MCTNRVKRCMDILVVNGITITVAEILVNPWLTPMVLGAHCAPCTQATFKSPALLRLTERAFSI